MTKKKTQEEIRTKLIARKDKIEKILGTFAIKEDMQPVDFKSEFPDLGTEEEENALEVSMYSDRISLENALEKIMRDINAALKNMEDGTYGTCKYCQKEIPEARLKARPVSSACVSCKEALTRGR